MDPLFSIMHDKSHENKYFVVCCSELLFNLLESARGVLIKHFKREIIDNFRAVVIQNKFFIS